MPLWADGFLEFSSPLEPWGWNWFALAAVPPAIVLLYFLKLRRRRVQVPSTLLWKRSVEDLHVNSLFQRLRRNLLLFLQLLIVGLVLFALTGPRVKGLTSQGQRIVLAIDESASMGATDVLPNRMREAQREAQKIISAMGSGDLVMIVAFSDTARVVANYTEDKNLLRSRLESVQPTQSSTSLREALQLVSGLANPQKYFEVEGAQSTEGTVATNVIPPKLFILTDGGFADVEGFSLGNIDPEILVIGRSPSNPAPLGDRSGAADPMAATAPVSSIAKSPPSDNVAIVALQSARNDADPEHVQIFGRVRNYRAEAVKTSARLLRINPERPAEKGSLVDALELEIPAQADQAFQFDLKNEGVLAQYEVHLDINDDLPLDDRAFVVLGQSRRAQVLLVTKANRFLVNIFQTETSRQLAELTVIKPDELSDPEVARDVAAGAYDLVLFDGQRPERAPEANAIYLGVLPPSIDVELAKSLKAPVILDWDMTNPLLQYVRDLGSVVVGEAITVEPPKGARVLIESEQGPLAFTLPRGAFVDVFLGFDLLRTNWPMKLSFPLFLYNTLHVLGGASGATDEAPHSPGQAIVLRPNFGGDRIDVIGPDGRQSETVTRSPQGTFVLTQTNRTGVYQPRWGDGINERTSFAVNLFDTRESDLSPRGLIPPGVREEDADQYRIKIGHNPVKASRSNSPAVQEWWWPITLLALGIVLVEWIIYNKRVFV